MNHNINPLKILLAGLLISNSLLAQTKSPMRNANSETLSQSASDAKIHELKVGDYLPDILIDCGDGSNKPTKRSLSSLHKNKLLIIDFWATWCSPCIQGLTQVDSVKKLMKDQVEVLNVAYEDSKKIKEFLRSHPRISSRNMLHVTKDVMLSQFFPHTIVPHAVWVDKNNKIINFTGDEEVTVENLTYALSNNIDLHKAKVDDINWDRKNYLAVGDSEVIDRTLISKYHSGRASTGHTAPLLITTGDLAFGPLPLINRILENNIGLYQLFMIAAYNYKVPLNNKDRFILEIKDSLNVVSPGLFTNLKKNPKYSGEAQWMRDHAFCYERIVAQPQSYEKMCKGMLNDLNNAFPIKGKLEIRDVKNYVMKLDQITKYLKPAESGEIPSTKGGNGVLTFKARSLPQIIDFFNEFNNTFPLVIESKDTTLYDLEIEFPVNDQDVFDMPTFIKLLKQTGFSLTEKVRPTQILVLSDK